MVIPTEELRSGTCDQPPSGRAYTSALLIDEFKCVGGRTWPGYGDRATLYLKDWAVLRTLHWPKGAIRSEANLLRGERQAGPQEQHVNRAIAGMVFENN
jgi:hypothetical protein